MARKQPRAPPLVQMSTGAVGHLLAWEKVEVDGAWWAWVSWVQDPVAGCSTRWSRSVVTACASPQSFFLSAARQAPDKPALPRSPEPAGEGHECQTQTSKELGK